MTLNLFSITAGSGGGVQGRSGGGAGADDEWILEPGKDYVFAVTNGSVTASTGTVNLFFYEESY